MFYSFEQYEERHDDFVSQWDIDSERYAHELDGLDDFDCEAYDDEHDDDEHIVAACVTSGGGVYLTASDIPF